MFKKGSLNRQTNFKFTLLLFKDSVKGCYKFPAPIVKCDQNVKLNTGKMQKQHQKQTKSQNMQYEVFKMRSLNHETNIKLIQLLFKDFINNLEML